MGEWTWRAFKVVQSLVERLPRSWAYALAVMAARFAWWFSPLARPRLEYNLKVACPELENDKAGLRRVSFLNFRNHAKAYADLLPLPLGPASIALRLGTPLLPVCVYRLPDDTYVAEAGPLVYARSTGNPRADQVTATQDLLRHIEGFIQQHPDQWHVPHRIWAGSV